MVKIKGKVQKGLGESQNTLKEQMPFFKQCYPEVAICKTATINILLERPLVIITPDFTSEPLPWHPAFKIVKGGEIFKFLKIHISLDGKEPADGWIYKAQFSPYRDNPFYVEVLAPQLDFSGTPNCVIEVISQCHEGVIVIGEGARSTGNANIAGSGR